MKFALRSAPTAPIRSTRPRVQRRRGYRPFLECLEERSLLAAGYSLVNLASDVPGVARVTDPALINPWGISFSPTGPFWVANEGAGVSDVYDGSGSLLPVFATVPAAADAGVGSPTGTVFNNSSGFLISANGTTLPGVFLFATEDGTIAGWNSFIDPTHAVLAVDASASGAGFTGLAIATDQAGQTFLYAADFTHGTIDVFDSDFKLASRPGAFEDPNLPAGYAPFNIQSVGNLLVVTYAKQDMNGYDEVAGAGLGVVDIYETSGAFVRRFATGGNLDAPWGVAAAPTGFGPFSDTLLIGNNGDGRISAFRLADGAFLGQIAGNDGAPIALPGLWGLTFGNDHLGGAADTLFFAAGGVDETHGRFGAIQAPGRNGADTAGPGDFDPTFPGERPDYPLPPVNGPRLVAANKENTIAISALQPMANSSLALFPTLAAASQPSSPAPAVWATAEQSAERVFFVSSADSAVPAVELAAASTAREDAAVSLNAFLNVGAAASVSADRVATRIRLTRAQENRSEAAENPTEVALQPGLENLVTFEGGTEDRPSPHALAGGDWTDLLRNVAAVAIVPLLWRFFLGRWNRSLDPNVRRARVVTLVLPQQN